jgi:predicted RNA binding protein YcfA (HicA-like mRNA interferase family)
MGRLAGFRTRDVEKRLRKLNFHFDEDGKGSHEIWRDDAGRRFVLV